MDLLDVPSFVVLGEAADFSRAITGAARGAKLVSGVLDSRG